MLLSVCACSQDFEGKCAFLLGTFVNHLLHFVALYVVLMSYINSLGAFQVLLLIKEADLKADCRLYTTLISTCAKSGKVDTMFEVCVYIYFATCGIAVATDLLVF